MELKKIKAKVEETLHVEIGTKTSRRDIVDARRIFTLIAFKNSKPKLKEIGELTGKDHAMAIHYRRSGKDLLKVDSSFRAKYNMVLEQL